VKHRETHPTFIDGCFACRISTVAIAPSATPSRHPEAAFHTQRESRWDKDMGAYKRLRANGVQPPRIDGAAVLESQAAHRSQIEMGQVGHDKKFLEGERLSADLGVT
jgi:hypothetical protein